MDTTLVGARILVRIPNEDQPREIAISKVEAMYVNLLKAAIETAAVAPEHTVIRTVDTLHTLFVQRAISTQTDEERGVRATVAAQLKMLHEALEQGGTIVEVRTQPLTAQPD